MRVRREGLEETGYGLDRGSLRHLGVIWPNSTILAGPIDLRYGQVRRCVARPDHEIDHCTPLDERDPKSNIMSERLLMDLRCRSNSYGPCRTAFFG